MSSPSKAFNKREAASICAVFDIPLEEMRECYAASTEKDAFCNYWRDRYAQSTTGRIKADQSMRKAA